MSGGTVVEHGAGGLSLFFYRLSHFIAWRSNFLSKAKENIINHHHYFAGLQTGTFGVWSSSVWSSCATPATTYYLTKWYAVKVSPHSQSLASVWLAPSINIYSKYLNALKVHYAVLRKGIQTQKVSVLDKLGTRFKNQPSNKLYL